MKRPAAGDTAGLDAGQRNPSTPAHFLHQSIQHFTNRFKPRRVIALDLIGAPTPDGKLTAAGFTPVGLPPFPKINDIHSTNSLASATRNSEAMGDGIEKSQKEFAGGHA